MREQVLSVIKQTFKLNSIDETISQETCDIWDSLHHLNLIIELESEFDVSFEPEEIAEMKDVASIERILKTK